ncbi:MAG: TIGR03936 family radical SAM-associated protein [Pirellulales bacterium]
MVRQRVRIRFSKTGDLRLISHRDLMRTMERLFRRASLPLSMSEGFHPKPRMTFPAALAVGIVGLDEVMELELSEHIHDTDALLGRLSAVAPPGLTFLSAEALPEGAKKAQVARVTLETPVPSDHQAAAREAVARVLAADRLEVEREGRSDLLDVRPLVEGLELDADVLRMRLKVTQAQGVRPRELLAALGLADLEAQGCTLVRTRVELGP